LTLAQGFAMNVPPRLIPQYTVADYQQWPGDWELVDGVPIAMGPSPFGPHAAWHAELVYRLRRALEEVADNEHLVLVDLDWIVDQNTVVRPDISLVRGPVPPRYIETPPIVVVEVLSASTADKDRGFKFDLYHELGVKYYVITDPDQRTTEVYEHRDAAYQRVPVAASYRFQLNEKSALDFRVG